jgi:hypothetical protein
MKMTSSELPPSSTPVVVTATSGFCTMKVTKGVSEGEGSAKGWECREDGAGGRLPLTTLEFSLVVSFRRHSALYIKVPPLLLLLLPPLLLLLVLLLLLILALLLLLLLLLLPVVQPQPPVGANGAVGANGDFTGA